MRARAPSLIGHKYGEDKRYEVIGSAGNDENRMAHWLVKCSECAKDSEMFGDGVFTWSGGKIRKGKGICGCCSGHRYSKSQWLLRVRRACEERGLEYLGIVGEFKGTLTVMKFRCPVDGHEWSTTAHLACINDGCPECSKRAFRIPEEVSVAKFVATGKYCEGSYFCKTSTKTEGGHPIWLYRCPACAKDEYSQAGLCTGVFESVSGKLEQGMLPCRCSATHAKTLPQLEYQVTKLCESEGYKFLGFSEGTKARKAETLKFYCPKHDHTTTRNLHHFLYRSSLCLVCNNSRGFNRELPASLYILRTDCNTFAGYGISNKVSERLGQHKRELKKQGMKIAESVSYNTTGSLAAQIEADIQQNFPLNSQDITGFRREATHAHLYEEVVAFVQSRLTTISEFSKVANSPEEICCI